ncbi:MAG: hypothetical protein COA99_15420 [Moraxellaceae bacterium]|nr:MAG: hypothetical protein COA99_15420 [Moraxellaceae bacterium]
MKLKKKPSLSYYPCFPYIAFLLLTIGPLPILSAKAELINASEKTALTDLFDLSIDELLSNMMVSISEASDREKSILQTPAIVSRYEAVDLLGMGLRTLKDFLSFVPGIVWDEGAFGNGQLMVRGISENFAQKVLFMLDDVPYWQPVHSAIPLLGIPLDAIDHIEVIRGPGLATQGSGATTGVIKIVTKDHLTKDIRLQLGSDDLVNLGGFAKMTIAPGHSLVLSAEYQDEDGFNAQYENIDLGVQSENKRAQDFNSLLARYEWETDNSLLNVTAHSYESQVNGVNNPSSLLPNQLTYRGDLFALSYDKYWSSDLLLTMYSDYNKHFLSFDIQDFPFAGSQGRIKFSDSGNKNFRWRSGARVAWTLNDNMNWVLGYEYEHRETGDYEISSVNLGVLFGVAIQADQANEQSIYSQLDWSIGDWRSILGVRYVNNNNAGEEYLPQVSVVYSIDEKQSIKALYSVGFNAPNFFQTSILIPNPPPPTVGNPKLDAEKVGSIDLSYTHLDLNSLFVFNIYYLEAINFVQRVNTGTEVTFRNSLDFDRWGYEVDYQAGSKKSRYFINLSYHHQGRRIIEDDIQARSAPRYTASVGARYHISGPHFVGSSWRFVDERLSENTSDIEEYHWLNLQYQYVKRSWEAYFNIENAFDDDITNPDVDSNTTQVLRHHEGRGYMAGFLWHF